MKQFNFHQSTEIVFGKGRVSEAGEIVSTYGRRCLMVSTPDALLVPPYERVKMILTNAGLCIASAGVTLPHGMGMAVG
ncbi:MAG: hypothetical protein DRI98_04300 [Bacteroidetes bacterium]|nr:MAG: hypothetical protein DRI98_04300 [Bacteroidota bacterium]